ncbi:hypothetical protein ACFQX6_33035 [Streptosporangium lutulentum]
MALTLIAALLAPRLAVVVRWAAGIRRLPEIAGGLVVLIMVAFAVRPWLQTVTRWPTTGDDRVNFEFIERTQQANGLPMDGSRLYYEESLHWVIWYVGIPTVVLATLAAAVLTRRLVREASSPGCCRWPSSAGPRSPRSTARPSPPTSRGPPGGSSRSSSPA